LKYQFSETVGTKKVSKIEELIIPHLVGMDFHGKLFSNISEIVLNQTLLISGARM
jgi:hypothetical protein